MKPKLGLSVREELSQLLSEKGLMVNEARITSAQSDEQQAIADVDRVQSELEQINSQIREAKLNLQQSEGDTQGRIQQAKSNVAAAKAQLLQTQAQVKQTEAEVKLARINRDRYGQLIKEGAINQQQFDQSQTTLDTAIATLEARQAAVNAAREQF
jgi:HlyD family secretion protein